MYDWNYAVSLLCLTSKISFSIYIIHERIYYLVFDLDKKYGLGIDYSNILVWISMMLSVIAVSIVWYMCIEKTVRIFAQEICNI